MRPLCDFALIQMFGVCVWYCSLHVSIAVFEDAELCANIYHKES